MSHTSTASLCFGASGGFTVAALLEVLRSPGMGGWLMFLASLISTVVGLWISERTRTARLAAEIAREKRDAARDQQIAQWIDRPRNR